MILSRRITFVNCLLEGYSCKIIVRDKFFFTLDGLVKQTKILITSIQIYCLDYLILSNMLIRQLWPCLEEIDRCVLQETAA